MKQMLLLEPIRINGLEQISKGAVLQEDDSHFALFQRNYPPELYRIFETEDECDSYLNERMILTLTAIKGSRIFDSQKIFWEGSPEFAEITKENSDAYKLMSRREFLQNVKSIFQS